jgi:hypothetical protein
MNRTALSAFVLLSLAGCQAGTPGATLGTQALTSAGVPAPTAQIIAADSAIAGQLFCRYNGMLFAVAGVKVSNATASSIATACSLLSIPGATATVSATPVAATVGQVAIVATVPDAAAAAVKASVPAA